MIKINNIIYKIKKRYRFKNDLELYKKLDNANIFTIEEKVCIYEDDKAAGTLDQHYFLQDIWMAKEVIRSGTKNHYDIGSRIDGFISHLLSVNIKVTMFDLRPLQYNIENLNFIQSDAITLNNVQENSIESLSSLHAVEHFGLGRYGDEINPIAWEDALKTFSRVMKSGGILYLSVPVCNTNKIVFNMHRIFKPETIVRKLELFNLLTFSYIEDYVIKTVDPKLINEIKFVDEYACGLFIFEKK